MSRKRSSRSRRNHRHERSDARRLALQLLYQGEMMEESPISIVEGSRYIAEEGVPSAYAERLLRGVEEHQDEIDDYLRTSSEHWTLSRMPAVDRSLLRLATYEMLYVEEVPLSVSINEAVELAKAFGGEDESHRFVNGILGRIARTIEAKAAEPAASDEGKTAIDLVAEAFAREIAEESADAETVSEPEAISAEEPESVEVAEESADAAPAEEPVSEDAGDAAEVPADGSADGEGQAQE